MIYLGDQAVGIATSLPIFGDIVKIEVGEYTPTSDLVANTIWINHSLGEIPDFIFVNTNMEGNTEYTNVYLVGTIISRHNFSGASRDSLSITMKTILNKDSLTASTGMINLDSSATNSQFLLTNSNDTSYLQSNITYRYIIGKFKEVTANANE